MTTGMILTPPQAVMRTASDETHALAEEIHQEEGLAPIDALCKALALSSELEQYAIDWDADAARIRLVEISS